MNVKKMETRVVRSTRDVMDTNGLRMAASALAKGSLVAFPTETVYGLGANALDEKAIREIYRVKGRPADNPMIVHVAHPDQIAAIVDEIPPMAALLMERFMPGPLTLVFKRASCIPDAVSAGLDTVAVRCPSHPVAQAFIAMAGVPVAAPSANLSGRPSPTRAVHVLQDLDGKIPYIIDGGECEVGLESTVVDVTGNVPVLLRPGAVTARQIQDTCGLAARCARAASPQEPVRSPGMKYRHYAPRATVVVGNGRGALTRVKDTVAKVREHVAFGKKVGVFASAMVEDEIRQMRVKDPDAGYPLKVFSFGDSGDSAMASARLFDALRSLDADGVDIIVVQALPDEGLGAAFMNRLRKASETIAGECVLVSGDV